MNQKMLQKLCTQRSEQRNLIWSKIWTPMTYNQYYTTDFYLLNKLSEQLEKPLLNVVLHSNRWMDHYH